MSDSTRARLILQGKQIVHVFSGCLVCPRCGRSLRGVPYIYAGTGAAEVYTLSGPVNKRYEVSCLDARYL
jgi:hypothetical protein